MGLTACLKKSTHLDQDTIDTIRATADAYKKEDGKSETEAVLAAIDDQINAELLFLADLSDEIVDRGGPALPIDALRNKYLSTRVDAASIVDLSEEEFQAMMDEVSPPPAEDTPVPKDEQEEPIKKVKPKKEYTADEVAAIIWRLGYQKKKYNRLKVTELRPMVKAIGGDPKLPKTKMIDALIEWDKARKLAALPAPRKHVSFRVGRYISASMNSRYLVQFDQELAAKFDMPGYGYREPDPALIKSHSKTIENEIVSIARHFGGSVLKKATSNEGMKTEKGIHFRTEEDMIAFLEHYKRQPFIKPDNYDFYPLMAEFEEAAPTQEQTGEVEPETGPPARTSIEITGEDGNPLTLESPWAEGDKIRFVSPDDGAIYEGTITGIEPDIDETLLHFVTYLEDPKDPDSEDHIVLFSPKAIKGLVDETSTENKQKNEAREEQSAARAAKLVAKHGWEGATEALTALDKLFGSKGKFSSGFTFDEESYEAAKPHFKKALESALKAGASLMDFIRIVLGELGEGFKPYLAQFQKDVKAGKIKIVGIHKDAESTDQSQEESGDNVPEPVDEGSSESDPGSTGSQDGTSTSDAGGQRGRSGDRAGVSESGPDAHGTRSTGELLEQDGEFRPESPATDDSGRSTEDGEGRSDAESAAVEAVTADARKDQKRLKKKPSSTKPVDADLDSIHATTPALDPDQAQDVEFAEKRLLLDESRGVMFTNGTGTGKTYTGLGVIHRMVLRGKKNIVIVVPGEKVANQWIRDGKNVGVKVTKLEDTKDAGTGVVVTSYANFAFNEALMAKNWDMVVHDEAHKLMENAQAEPTMALKASRAITGHPLGRRTYAEAMEPELMNSIRTLNAETFLLKAPDDEFTDLFNLPPKAKVQESRRQKYRDMGRKYGIPNANGMPISDLAKALDAARKKLVKRAEKAEGVAARLAQIKEELIPLNAEFNRRQTNIHNPNREALWSSHDMKRLDLSATPFAYVKNVDHAEGFLFEYEQGEVMINGSRQSGRELFFVEKFGYQISHHKLTKPDSLVDTGRMEREFNAWLRSTGALRSRKLNVPFDYSREFISIEDFIGRKIDDALSFIEERANDRQNPLADGYAAMLEKVKDQFQFHHKVQLLEAIKAPHAIERARKHLALGRKVVIFHSRIKGGAKHPFRFSKVFADPGTIAEEYNKAVDEFNAANPEVVETDFNQTRPLDLFLEEFGDEVTFYNGTLSDKKKVENPDKFNRDNSGVNVIVVQDDGGKEGISLHDTSGKHPRVLINLGLPFKPTQAIQIEGRTYRHGQQSDAPFEYFSTDTNFERRIFAEKISERASTAENLAMGDDARGLKESFIQAYEAATSREPDLDQGKGGKELDAANWSEQSPFGMARSDYFATHKNTRKRGDREGTDYFATPEPLGFKMVEWANIKPGEFVLEPSAGHGAIGRYFPENTTNTFIEPSVDLASRLSMRTNGKVREEQFESLHINNKFDAIVMNPPYGSGGKTAMEHLEKAMTHLHNGGRIVALIPEGPAADKKFHKLMFGDEYNNEQGHRSELEMLKEKRKKLRKDGKTTTVVDHRIHLLENFHITANIGLPNVVFERAGTKVKSRIVIIDRLDNEADAAKLKAPARTDIDAEDINDFFDKIEYRESQPRIEPQKTAREFLEDKGISVTADDVIPGRFFVRGNTFPYKKPIGDLARENDGSWDTYKKEWSLVNEEVTRKQVESALAHRIQQWETPDEEAQADLTDDQQEGTQERAIWSVPEDQEYKSTDASINRDKRPATIKIVEDSYGGWKSGTVNADIGGGRFDNVNEYMTDLGSENVVYDPFNRSEDHNKSALEKIAGGKADTVTISNVLNVIKEKDIRNQVLREAADAVKPGGTVYIQIYEGPEGNGIGRNTKGDVWQENRPPKDFLEEIREVFPDAELKHGLISAKGFITATKPRDPGVLPGSKPKAEPEPHAGFKLGETTHSRDGHDLFVASPVKRVSRENYLEMNKIAKSHGGGYSSWRGKGAIPGFQFRTPEARESFMEDIADTDLMASLRPDGEASTGVPPDQVEQVTSEFLEDLNVTQDIDVNIYDTWEDLVQVVAVNPAQARHALGYMQGNQLHIVAGNLRPDDNISDLLRHEIVTHYGLSIMDPSDKLAILKRIVASRTIPFVKEHWDEVSKTYGERYKNKPLKIAEEVLARISEQDFNTPPTVWQQIVDMIVNALRKVGLLKRSLTYTEARNLLKAMAQGIRNGDMRSDEIRAFTRETASATPGADESELMASIIERDDIGADQARVHGLPMDKESRQKRAKGMGFDTTKTWYHGTMNQNQDNMFRQFRSGMYHGAIFFTENPQLASYWAGSDLIEDNARSGGAVVPVHLKLEKTLDSANLSPEEVRSLKAWLTPERLSEYREAVKTFLDDDFISSIHLAPEGSTRSQQIDMILSKLKVYDWIHLENPVIQGWIKQNGYDSFRTVESGEPSIGVYNPENIRSVNASFDPSQAGEPDILAARRKRKKRKPTERQKFLEKKKMLMELVPGLKKVWPYLTRPEQNKLNRGTVQNIVNIFEAIPDANEMATVAYAGRAKRGWYKYSAQALVEIFGAADASRFAALLAALSPQTSVESNLLNALNVWAGWIEAGRPTGRRAIMKVMANNVQGDKGEKSVLDAWKNNSLRALQSEDPFNIVISGPKVNSFMLNLKGVVDEVTNDTWMANYALMKQAIFGGSMNKAGTEPGKSSGYIAMNAVVRKAAKIATQRTGETWTPAEIQETVWSWIKSLTEMAAEKGEKRSARQIINEGALTADIINSTPDFERLFIKGVYKEILEGAGYHEQINVLKETVKSRDKASRGDAGRVDPRSHEGSGLTESSFGRHIRRAARRADILKEKKRQGKLEEDDGMLSLRPNKDRDEFMKRAGLGPRPSWSERMKGTIGNLFDRISADAAKQGTLDRFHGINRATKRNLGNLPVEQDPYVTARLATGISSVMRAILTHGQPRWNRSMQHLEKIPGTKGLLEILAPISEDINDWLGWMVANRAARLMREGKENNFTEDQIRAGQALGTPDRIEAFRKAAKEFAAFKRSILDVAEEAGLIDPESREVWDLADWIPFYRQMEGEDDVVGPTGAGKSLANKSSGIRQLRGGESGLNDPLENIVMNFHRLLDASLKNNAVRQAVAAAPDSVEKANYKMKTEIVPQSQVKTRLMANGMTEEMVDSLTPGIFKGLQKMWAIEAPKDKDVIRVMVGGKAKYYRISDPLLLRAVTSFPNIDNIFLEAGRSFKRVLTSAVTATPEFMLRNFIRDTLSTAITSREMVAAAGAFKGLVKSYRENGAAEHMLFAGASFASGYIDGTDTAATAKSIRRELRKKGMSASDIDSFMGSILDGTASMWEKYRHVSESIENANREAVFEATLKDTGSVTKAALEAKDLMDFSLRGDWIAYQLMADLIPFFNARIQGMYRLARTGGDWKKTVAQLSLRGGILLMIPTIIAALSNLDNDDYEELPDWDKDTYWHLWLNGEHVRIPKPFEVGVLFGTMPERGVHAIFGKDDMKKLGERVLWNMTEQLNLVQWPQFMKPVMEARANWDTFAGRRIESISDENKSASLRYNARTSATMRELIKAMGPIADEIEMSPKMAEHLLVGYLGTFGAWGLSLADFGARALADDPVRPTLRPDDILLLKVLYRGDKNLPAYSTQYITDVYEAAREYHMILSDYKSLMREGRAKEAAARLEKNRDRLTVFAPMAAAAKGITALNKRIDAVMTDRTKTPAQKRKEIDDLLGRRNELAREQYKKSKAEAKRVGNG